jgi:hypothetical protein
MLQLVDDTVVPDVEAVRLLQNYCPHGGAGAAVLDTL